MFFGLLERGLGAFFFSGSALTRRAGKAALLVSAVLSGLNLAATTNGQTLDQTQTAVSASPGTSITATYSPAAVAGRLLVAVVALREGQATTTVSVTVGGTWTNAVSLITEGPGFAIFYKAAVGGDTTVTISGTNLPYAVCFAPLRVQWC